MRYKSEHKRQAHEAILAAAGRRLRLQGFHGVGVDGLMAEAGLTSGAFYTQFASKTNVLLEVLRRGLEEMKARLLGRRRGEKDWFWCSIDEYLSGNHRENIAEGCLLPSLSVDAARTGGAAQELYQDILCQIVDALQHDLPSESGLSARQRAWATLALLAGGVMLARAVPEGDTASEILDACRRFAKR